MFVEKQKRKNSKFDNREYNICERMINGLKTRKIFRLKELHMQKQQILDLQNTIQQWMANPNEYADLVRRSLKDLRRKKVKYMNTFYKYYMSRDWSWLLHKKAREINPKKQFKPIYNESLRMSRLMNTDDDDSAFGSSYIR
jgi:hypothetical protein